MALLFTTVTSFPCDTAMPLRGKEIMPSDRMPSLVEYTHASSPPIWMPRGWNGMDAVPPARRISSGVPRYPMVESQTELNGASSLMPSTESSGSALMEIRSLGVSDGKSSHMMPSTKSTLYEFEDVAMPPPAEYKSLYSGFSSPTVAHLLFMPFLVTNTMFIQAGRVVVRNCSREAT